MSNYQDKLREHIETHPDFIKPSTRRNEVLGFLKKPLNDLCISRPKSRLNWGIELPFDKDFVTYVWFDALLNYITAIGWRNDNNKFEKWWPANYHLMAKDILTTHAVYWPTMLMASDVQLPKTILSHGWWMMGETKMSKSLGNVINPMDFIKQYGVDPVRYFLMRDMVLGQDASFTEDGFIRRYNSDLANDFGNLVNRVTILIHKHFDSKIPQPGKFDEVDLELIGVAKSTPQIVREHIKEMKIPDAIEVSISLMRNLNRYLETRAPWKLVKEDKSDRSVSATTLFLSADILRIGAQLLHPVMPSRIETILSILGASKIQINDVSLGLLKAGSSLGEGKSPFPRIDVK